MSAALDNKNRNNFFMYYSTMLKDTKEKALGYAVSYNGTFSCVDFSLSIVMYNSYDTYYYSQDLHGLSEVLL